MGGRSNVSVKSGSSKFGPGGGFAGVRSSSSCSLMDDELEEVIDCHGDPLTARRGCAVSFVDGDA